VDHPVTDRDPASQRLDAAALARSDGAEGRPARIAHAGAVYDVGASKLWRGGLHMGRHRAGTDLTAAIAAAPHGPEVLERVPRVGTLTPDALAEPAPAPRVPEPLARLLARFPVLRRHPHPMTVHFPIVFLLSAGAFTLLSLATGDASLERTGFSCLAGGLLFSPVAILFGHATWWLNYGARPLHAVRIKIRLSYPLLALAAALFAWRWTHPGALGSLGPAGTIYVLGLLAMAPLVSVIGWFGASLVFPLEPPDRPAPPG
jgi:predicted heme/steroid binding protein/uncharacterized membrane protein